METQIKSKKFKFLEKGMKGQIRLTNGTTTTFEIDESGEYTKSSNENDEVVLPIIYELQLMLMSTE
jgi:hypothetical protein